MSRLVPENIDTWKKGWIYDRTHQAEQKRKLLQWMDATLGFETKEDTWSSSS